MREVRGYIEQGGLKLTARKMRRWGLFIEGEESQGAKAWSSVLGVVGTKKDDPTGSQSRERQRGHRQPVRGRDRQMGDT